MAPRDLASRLQIGADRPRCIFAFAAASTDLDALAAELATFAVPVIACTTAGQIGPAGFEAGDVTAAAIFDGLEVSSFLIPSLANLDASIATMAAAVDASGVLRTPDVDIFGLLLVDGLANAEERLMAALHAALPQLSIVGGSAGDDLEFARTMVFDGQKFVSGAAVLHIVTTRHRTTALKVQHHVPTEHRLVITSATPSTRTVHAINGRPAAEAYAAAIGVAVAELTDVVMAQHPMILRIGTESYVRSVRTVQPDGSLELFCAIEAGLVMRLGASVGIRSTLETTFAQAVERVGECVLVVGFDCILRRLEIQRERLTDEIGGFFATRKVIGFSTFGEQCNALHANQTFTGYMIGAAR